MSFTDSHAELADPDRKNVWIVIVNFNNAQFLKLCVESLSQLTFAHFSIVIVDNRSTDHSVSELRELALRYQITLICSPENAGFAAGVNLGVHHACLHGARYLWVLHPDTLVEPDALTALLTQAKEEKGDFILGSKIYALPAELSEYRSQCDNFAQTERSSRTLLSVGGWFSPESNEVGFYGQGEKDLAADEGAKECEFLSGCSLFFSATLVHDFGYLPEEFFWYFEDIAWCQNLKDCGVRVVVCPSSHVWHRDDAERLQRPVPLYYFLRNKLCFFYGVSSLDNKRRMLWETVRSLLKIPSAVIQAPNRLTQQLLNAQRRAYVDFLRGRRGKRHFRTFRLARFILRSR